MAIVREAVATAAPGGSTTTIVIDKPTGVVAGDVLVAYVRGAAASGTVSATAPSGWVDIAHVSPSQVVGISAFYKVAGGSEPANYTFTYNQTISQRAGGIARYSGVDNTTPGDVTATTNSGLNTSPVGLSVTTVTAGAMLVMPVGFAAPAVYTSPSGMTDFTSGRSAYSDGLQASAGASGNKTATLDTSTTWATILWALRPATGGGTTVTIADTGSGVDALGGIAASLALADTGVGADTFGAAAALALTDSATGSDALLAYILAAIADTGVGSDALAGVAAVLSVADTGAGVDSLSGITVSLAIADTGSGADVVDLLTEILKSIADSGLGTDAIAGITVRATVVDTGTGADTPAIAVSLSIADTGSGLDALSVLMATLISVADSGVGADSFGPITVSLAVADTATAIDTIAQIAAVLQVLDTATGVDAVVRYSGGLVTIALTLRNRSTDLTLRNRSLNLTLRDRT